MNGSIVAGNEASETYANVAGFVGSASNADRCNYIRLTNNADITAIKSASEARAAGIITYAGNTSTIVGCRNNGKISAGTLADTPASETALIAAGIIASYNGASPMILKDCINTGDIVSKGSVGGINALITKGGAEISGCDNYGTVTTDALKSGSIQGSVNDGLTITAEGNNDKIGQTAPAPEELPVPTDERKPDPAPDTTPDTTPDTETPDNPPDTGDYTIYVAIIAIIALAVSAVVIQRKKIGEND